MWSLYHMSWLIFKEEYGTMPSSTAFTTTTGAVQKKCMWRTLEMHLEIRTHRYRLPWQSQQGSHTRQLQSYPCFLAIYEHLQCTKLCIVQVLQASSAITKPGARVKIAVLALWPYRKYILSLRILNFIWFFVYVLYKKGIWCYRIILKFGRQ